MPFAPVVVLHSTRGYHESLDALVEQFLADGVQLVAVWGIDCERVEDIIDEQVVGEATDPDRGLMTSSHADTPLDEVMTFARMWLDLSDIPGEPQLIAF